MYEGGHNPGDIVEVFIGGDVWARAEVVDCLGPDCLAVVVRFGNGMIDSPPRKIVRPISPLTLLAEQAD